MCSRRGAPIQTIPSARRSNELVQTNAHPDTRALHHAQTLVAREPAHDDERAVQEPVSPEAVGVMEASTQQKAREVMSDE